MRPEHLHHLCCPDCRSPLSLRTPVAQEGPRIEAGELACTVCGSCFPIIGHIPRFVSTDNYAAGFGLEWTKHRRTQYDSYTGLPLSERRFFEETGWPRALNSQVLIEAGSGSGRFTEPAATTGATVLSFDYSAAVESNYASNGWRENVLIVQADVYRMPFRQADRLFCFGMLQHTPDPERAFAALVSQVKPGGEIVADVYRKSFARHALQPKYWVRPVTRRIPPERLYRLTRRYVDLMWPLAQQIRSIPKFGKILNWRLLVADYSDLISDDRLLREWSYLDTFDMLAPRYDIPQTLETVNAWGTRVGLESFTTRYGYNGIEIHGLRPTTGSNLPCPPSGLEPSRRSLREAPEQV